MNLFKYGLKIGLLIWAVQSYAQESLKPSGDVVPPSPTVAALNQYVDVPVSHYTGVPEIGVPIFTIPMQQFSVPISLSYHASGLKVADHASWVGAGWSLNAGGSVSRVIRGLPDEYALGEERGFFHNAQYFNSEGNFLYNVLNCETSAVEGNTPGIVEDIASGKKDLEPDVFYLSAPGLSAKFVFNQDREPVLLSASDLDIGHPFTAAANGQANYPVVGDFSWTITAPNGLVYEFTAAEYTSTLTKCQPNGTEEVGVVERQNAWYLTKMSYGSEYVNFSYENETQVYESLYSQSEQFQIYSFSTIRSNNYSPQNSFCTTESTVKAKRLASIESSNGYLIEFGVDTLDRNDLNGSKALETITIKKNGEKIGRYELNHSYFAQQKLKLDGIDQVALDSSGNKIHLKQFEYFSPVQVPSLNSTAQDFYGYFNGKISNQNLVPDWRDEAYHFNPNGADRSIDLEKTKVGTLSKIIHPTGGYTSFDYELHDVAHPNFRETQTLQLYVSEGSEENPQTGISENFIVQNEASLSLLMSSEEPDVEGKNSGFYVEKLINNDWVIQTLEKAESTLPVPLLGIDLSATNRFLLPAGTYRIRAVSYGFPVDLKVVVDEYRAMDFAQIGGLRVREITSYDPISDQYLHDMYEYTIGDTTRKKSSGVVFTLPHFGAYLSEHFRLDLTDYFDENPPDLGDGSGSGGIQPYVGDDTLSITSVIWIKGDNNSWSYEIDTRDVTREDFPPLDQDNPFDYNFHWGNADLADPCEINAMSLYININSSPAIPIATMSGGHVGYTKVKHYKIRNEDKDSGLFNPAPPDWTKNAAIGNDKKMNGMVEYGFVNEMPVQPEEEPFVPALDLTFKNGKTDSVKTFELVGGELLLKRLQVNHYQDAPIDRDLFITALKTLKVVHRDCSDCAETDYKSNYYYYNTNWNYLDRTTSFIYEDDGTISSEVQYQYDSDDHHFQTGTETTNSEGEVISSSMIRLADRPALIQQQVTKVDGEQVSGERLTYQGNRPLSYAAWNRDPSEVPAEVVTLDPHYPVELTNSYDGDYLITEIRSFPSNTANDSEEIRNTFLWGYNGLDLVASLVNVSETELSEHLSALGVNRGWFKDLNNRGNYLTKLLALQARLTQHQQLKIFIHEQPFGPTTVIDETGYRTHFEYDAFGRLFTVRDQDQNVLKIHKYKYINQNF
ncbi:MAG: RHS repeat domain-containing protein [Cytophagales bacterium]|nr:RHS repeat domain-containing protein [Cytophagales bacterium]